MSGPGTTGGRGVAAGRNKRGGSIVVVVVVVGGGGSDSGSDEKESDGSEGGDDVPSLASTALSPPTVWLERKVRHDPRGSSGKRSFKERVALTGAEAAALVEALPPPPPRREKNDSCSCSSSSSSSPLSPSPLSSLAAAALCVALGPGAVPLLRTEAERTAFEDREGGLRVTIDERVRMSAVVGKGWLFDDDEIDDEKARRLLFPFTIVEVKLSG